MQAESERVFFGEIPASGLKAVGVIMAGGSGTRFWPMSRTNFPKQFLPLGPDSNSLIQATALRIRPITGPKGVLVVTAQHQRKLVQEQLPQAGILAEPIARNTAACVGFAAVKILSAAGDVPMLCLPADHVVIGEAEICAVYEQAIALAARENVLITIGIKPSQPETGYGYVRRGKERAAGPTAVYDVAEFVEKPNRETAERYLASGEYFWNSGMFIWRPSVILAEIKKSLPELAQGLEEIKSAFGTADESKIIGEIYGKLPSISVDVGIMERASNVCMFAGDSFVWSDVGSWSSWSDTLLPQIGDAQSNVVKGNAAVISSKGCSIIAQKRFVAAIGLENIIVVETDDAVLVCRRDKAQEVKEVVNWLEKNGQKQLL